jgi:hypothetical protein
MKIQNPLETVFDLEERSMDIERDYAMVEAATQVTPTEPPPDVKDEDDILVEKRIDEVYDAAIEAFQNQSAYQEIIEPRYAARNAEVAANYLNIALAAATSRAKVKTERKRANQQFVPYANAGGKNTTNVIVASREDIMKAITIDNTAKALK